MRDSILGQAEAPTLTEAMMRAAWWWIDRWRNSTAYTDMTAEEQGLYRNLLDEVWKRESHHIPDDQAALAKISGDPEAWKRSGERVMRWMRKDSEGWTNDTALEVIKESTSRAAKQKRYRDGKRSPERLEILSRDGPRCGICGKVVQPELAAIDHIKPQVLGGGDEVSNLQLAHPKCNSEKGSGRRVSGWRHGDMPAIPPNVPGNVTTSLVSSLLSQSPVSGADRRVGQQAPANPLVTGRRPALESECLQLAARMAEFLNEDPIDTMARASGYAGARTTKLNPASMSDDRLANTVRDLRRDVAEEERKRGNQKRV